MTIRYNPTNAFVNAVISLIRQTKAIKIIDDTAAEYVPNEETLEAIDDIKNGRVYHAGSTEDLFEQILG